MMRGWRIAFVAALVAACFAWGLAVGLYHVFPYELIRHLKNAIEGENPDAPLPMWVNEDAFTVADADLILATRADVVMLGDSVTAGGRWQEVFPGVSIVNRGIGGDTVSGVLRRAPRIVAMTPKKIFVMIGVNDILARNATDEILSRYDRALAVLTGSGAQLFVQPVLTCDAIKCDEPQRAALATINAALPELAKRHGATFVDLNARMSNAGGLKPPLTWDGVHLTGQGYAAWRDAIETLVRVDNSSRKDSAAPRKLFWISASRAYKRHGFAGGSSRKR